MTDLNVTTVKGDTLWLSADDAEALVHPHEQRDFEADEEAERARCRR